MKRFLEFVDDAAPYLHGVAAMMAVVIAQHTDALVGHGWWSAALSVVFSGVSGWELASVYVIGKSRGRGVEREQHLRWLAQHNAEYDGYHAQIREVAARLNVNDDEFFRMLVHHFELQEVAPPPKREQH